MKKISGVDIDEQWTEWAVQYPDGEILIVEDEDDAKEIVRCAKTVLPKIQYRVKQRECFVTEWTDPA